MLADWRRFSQALTDPALRRSWAARLVVRSTAWVVFLAALSDVWRVDHRLVPLLVIAAAVGRLIPWRSVQGVRVVLLGLVLLYVAAVYARYIELIPPNTSAIVLFGLVAVLAVHGFVSDWATPASEQWAMTYAERLSLLVGPLVAVGLLLAVDPIGVIIGGGLVLVAVDWFTSRPRVPSAGPAQQKRSANGRAAAVYLAAAAGSGALATSILGGAFYMVGIDSRLGSAAAAVVAAAVLAVVGLGASLGPLPIPRILLRVPAAALAVGLALVMGIAAATAALVPTPLIAVPALVILGGAAAGQHSLRVIALRRLSGSGASDLASASIWALTAGQVVGAAVMLGGPTQSGAAGIIVLVALGQVVLVVASLFVGGVSQSLEIGGLSLLPVRSIVHKLSWDTRPAAQPSDFAQVTPRVQRIVRWINRHANVEKLSVRLPESGREYEIYRPTEESRERLFERGQADPEKQMPYWAKVWPSGVALADVVVERKEEVAGKHVLELGAGLGVTACAVLEHGGDLVTADYSALPLAHCRLNTLVNTGRAPKATCFNWRHLDEIEAATSQPEFRGGFPLIIAGDVLYEGRDAEPLLNVIERLLVADGSLWLAEPVRKTAQRFLDSAAALGWEIESRQVSAEWPDATNGPVNLHFLRRSGEPDRVVADLGGWRI